VGKSAPLSAACQTPPSILRRWSKSVRPATTARGASRQPQFLTAERSRFVEGETGGKATSSVCWEISPFNEPFQIPNVLLGSGTGFRRRKKFKDRPRGG
jgi:hypothetical protein